MNTNSYFTIQVLTEGTVIIQIANATGSESPGTIYYWINSVPNAARDNYDGSIVPSETAQYIKVNNANPTVGTIIRLYRPETTALCFGPGDDTGSYIRIYGTAETKLSGNLASLIGFSETIPAACFRYFLYNGNVVDAGELDLPWTTLSQYCFVRFLYGNTKLIEPPTLKATTLAGSCYLWMFRGCTALSKPCPITFDTVDTYTNSFEQMYHSTGITTVTLPKLHFTNGARLIGMFRGCTNLKTATIETFDETIPTNAYQHLFRGCTGLETVICKAKSFHSNAFADWLLDASATGTFIKDKDTTWPSGNSGIPSGWTIKNTNQNTQFLDFSSADRIMYKGNNHIKCIYGPNNTLLWSEEEYLTVETLVGGNAVVGLLKNQGSSSELITLYYWVNTYPNAARDNYTGTITSSRSSNVYITGLSVGDKIRFYRAEQTSWRYSDSDYTRLVINSANLYGNIASLFGFVSTPPAYACFNLFNGCGIVDASGMIIPWNTLSENCFYQTFINCSSLTGQPILTSQNLASFCYRAMFRSCHSLTNVTTIYTKNINVQWPFYCMYQLCNGFTSVTIPEFQGYYQGCLGGMFWGCPNLTSAELKVPSGLSLPNSPFTQMFISCSNLNSVKCNADTFASIPFTNTNWLSGVASTGTFTKKAGTNWASGVSGIPSGWTVVEV